MLTKRPDFPYESLEAFIELKKCHHGRKYKAQKIDGATAAAVAAPAAIGAAGYTAAGIAAKSCATSIVSAESIATGAAGSIVAGIVLPIFVTGVLVAAGVACAVIAVVSSKTRDYAQVGDYSSIAHGNIVALHSERHNRFIRLCRGRVNGRGGRKDIDKFPEKWGSEEFLVIQLAESTFAFYSVPRGQYICMNKNRTMAGIDSKAEEDDENFDEHEFIVRDEGNGKISLLSLRHDCFVRMDDKGNMDGNAVVAGEWEHFNVVLLLKNPVSTD